MHSLYETFAMSLWDVTLRQVRGTSPSGAISWKTNSLSSRLKQRIYTSTPKYKLNKQTQQQRQQKQQQQEQRAQKQCSDAVAIGFCSLVEATTTTTTASKYICVGGAKGQALDVCVKALLLSFAIVLIAYGFVLIMSYNVQALEWWEEHQLSSKLSPLLCGILIAGFSFGIVYMDSEEPGVNPPLAFWRGRNKRKRGLQLSYVAALFVGIIVAIIMYMDL